MKDYSTYQVEDFLTDDDFINWVRQPTEQSSKFWGQWLTDPVQGEKIRFALATLKAFQFQDSPVPADFYLSLKGRIDDTIQQSTQTTSKSRVLRLHVFMKVAAVFILLIGSAFLLRQLLLPAKMIVFATAYKEVRTFELPDHSTVTLNANSSLEYPENWNNDNRDVTLKGEGFFKVTHIDTKDGAEKFTVHAAGVQVAVLGTEFNVKSRDENTSVMLQSGKVQLKVDGTSDTRVMKPNDFIQYDHASRRISASVVNPSYHTAWVNHKYVFTRVTLREICSHLEDYYGFHIAIKDSSLVNQQISGTLLLADENSLLQTLSSILNANIDHQGQNVTISSK
jgi:transmembrane sensor